jgi:hypothetical protein
MPDHSAFDRALDALLAMADRDSRAELPRRAIVEHLLTTGYAEMLELEAERLRLTRILERAIAPPETAGGADVAALSTDLSRVTDRLVELRDRLAAANQQFGPITPATL